MGHRESCVPHRLIDLRVGVLRSLARAHGWLCIVGHGRWVHCICRRSNGLVTKEVLRCCSLVMNDFLDRRCDRSRCFDGRQHRRLLILHLGELLRCAHDLKLRKSCRLADRRSNFIVTVVGLTRGRAVVRTWPPHYPQACSIVTAIDSS